MTTKQEFNCVFCKDNFDNKEDLQEHFRKHGDPKYKNRFERDTQASDDKSKEKAEMVSCDVCAQMFPTISKAITHKHKVHPDHDAKYFCPWCGKLFTMKHLYNVHVQSNHGKQDKIDGKRFHCDICSVDFYIPSAMISHNKFFHRQDTDLPDIGQSKKVKFYEQEVMPVYYCAFCGEEYENKVNLIKHTTDDHGDENQSPDEVLKCPMCEAVFYHLDAYEIHLTFHSSEDMYSIKNLDYTDLLDYSLETVPPIIEKVESMETEDPTQDTEAESTINAVGIEKFLELAMDQSEDSNPVKAKKHKKRKKSKKSAITLDEFLSMNQDVFGEDIDFQGVEEVPTLVVKKQLKNNKKTSNAMVTSVELDKLKKAGIVVKKKVNRNPVIKGLKVTNSMPIKNAPNKPVYKLNKVRGIETSSEVLTKLINQSNNQIKIVKKVNPNTVSKELKQIKDFPSEEAETALHNMSENPIESNSNIEEISTPIPKSDRNITNDLSSPTSEQLPVIATTDNSWSSKLSKSNVISDIVKDTTLNTHNDENVQKESEISDSDGSPVNYKICDGVNAADPDQENLEKTESDQFISDSKLENSEKKSGSDNCINKDKFSDGIKEKSDNFSNNDSVFNASASSLSTLKHLSHLITVKPVSLNRNNLSTEPTSDKIIEAISHISQPLQNDNKETSSVPLADGVNLSKPKNYIEKNPTMDALKTLSKNITIKSLSTKRNIDDSESEDSEIAMKEKVTSNLVLQDVNGNKNMTIKKSKIETVESKPNCQVINSSNSHERKCMPGKQPITKPSVGKIPSKITVEKADNNLPTTNANILRRLTNITTKPIVNKNNCLPSTIKQANIAKTITKSEEKKEEIIEIFDVDDSEDEEENSKQRQSVPQLTQNSKSMDALKNLSKNITIKSMNHQSAQKNIKIENTIKNIKIEKEDNNSQTKFKEESNIDTLINLQNRSNAFKNVLQGLCKNITIKSRNTSPSQFPKLEEYNSQDSKVFEDNEASYSEDSSPGNVKITELDEAMDHDSDHGEDSQSTETLNTNLDNPIVESPKESCSENEDEDLHDFETDIKASTLQKGDQSMNSTINSVCLNNLKNVNKNITIKSLSKSSTDNDEKTKQALTHDSEETPQRKQLPAKPSNQVIKQLQSDNISINRTPKNVDHTTAQSWNKKVCAMNQVNTVNKEVTVKTIQTKTVIQEITTTVTKTVKTVNQTMKQEVRNSLQTSTPMVSQRIQGIRPSQSKNLQGVVIRHAPPMLGARASNTIAQIRPAGTIVRPSKQIVPMRTGIHSTRPNNPRMAAAKNITPSPSANNQVIGRHLKISPTAMVSKANAKRPNTEDVSGPFSCFKKPKESLIPVSDIPSFASSSGEGSAQFTSASHTSCSNFTSTTNIVKGNAVVTAKQMKSEVNATSQLMGRLSNKTGLKIMTSQQKQSQVQEHSESSSPMRRTTLEAIQRLQQQGLLVKKPRVEVNDANEDSDHDGDNNAGYGSTDEHDE